MTPREEQPAQAATGQPATTTQRKQRRKPRITDIDQLQKKRFLSVRECALLLDKSVRFISQLCLGATVNGFPARKIRGTRSWIIDQAEMIAWLSRSDRQSKRR